MDKLALTLAFLVLLPLGSAAASDSPTQEELGFFESKIRPVLVKHCYKCHSGETKSPKGGLRVDTQVGIQAGGESGQAVIPGKVDESLLIGALRYEDYEMPPAGQLSESVIADFERWVQMGAPDPRTSAQPVQTKINIEEGRGFWAFQSPELVNPPGVISDWPKDPIDRFVLARMQSAGLEPVEDANPLTWLRRVTFDLTGLPPTEVAVEAFADDHSREARQQVVDGLLQSEAFGERWGRHWLDVARYAESMGKTRNFPFTFAWRYRNYVIDAFNKNLPYDRFLTEQLAGDLLPADSEAQRDRQLIATGFLALGSLDLNERDPRKFIMDRINEQIDVTSRAIMGTTIGCARCHDHKFDPIPTDDYYALAGFFLSTDTLNGYAKRRRGGSNYRADEQLVKLSAAKKKELQPQEAEDSDLPIRLKRQKKALNNRIAELKQKIKTLRGEQQRWFRFRKRGEPAKELPNEFRERMQQARQQLGNARRRLNRITNGGKRGLPPPQGPYAMGVRDAEHVLDCAVNVGGDPHNLGTVVPRGFPQVMTVNSTSVESNDSGRLELAHWLTQPDHPLTSRVMVNRIWHHLMGTGLVRTVDNFGVMGERPSHPELLDYLAVQFVRDGWSVKQIVRQIVLSRTYGLSSVGYPYGEEIDPDNRYRWRMSRRRLEAEAIRDSMMAISGQLTTARPQRSPIAEMYVTEIRRVGSLSNLSELSCRSVYLPVVRSQIPHMFDVFDYPEPSEVRGLRDVTTVAPQALFFMHDQFVLDTARWSSERMLKDAKSTRKSELVMTAYRRTLGRLPTKKEKQEMLFYLRDTSSNGQDRWTGIYRALFSTAEFRYRL